MELTSPLSQRGQDHGPGGSGLGATLEVLAEHVGISIDWHHCSQAVQHAETDHPGPAAEQWEMRLCEAAAALGLRCSPLTLSFTEAIAHAGSSAPLVAFISSAHAGEGEWLVLSHRQGAKASVTIPGSADKERKVKASELARMCGAESPRETMIWCVVTAMSPIGHGGDDHGAGHGGHGTHGPEHLSPFRQLLKLLRPELRDLVAVCVFAIAIGLLSLIVPLAAEELVASVGRGVLYQPLIMLSLVLFVCLGLAAAMRLLQVWIVELLQQRIFVRVVADLAYRLPMVRQSTFDAQHGPELVNRFFDVLTFQKTIASLLLDGVAIVVTATVGVIVLAFYHIYLSVFVIVLVFCVFFMLFVLGRGAVTTSIRESIAKYDVAFWLQELVHHPRAFKKAGGSDLAWHEADRLSREYLISRRAHFRVLFRQIFFALFLQVTAGTAMLGLGGWLVIQRALTLGQLVAAELIVTVVLTSLTKFGKSLESFYDLLASTDKLSLLLGLPLERGGGEGVPSQPAGASLRLVDLGYTYPESGRTVLTDVNAFIAPGERIALVGSSGRGKSTLSDMIFGLREPTSGRIELDGVALRDLRLASLRDKVAVVRGAEIIDGTVLENVQLGRTQFGPQEVRQALAEADLLDDVADMRDGLHTYLLTGGLNLSIGQATRLVLARALIGRPRLLLLDETLDALDNENLQEILPRLVRPDAPWTLIVVSRRPEILAACGRRLILEPAQPGQPSTIRGESPPRNQQPVN